MATDGALHSARLSHAIDQAAALKLELQRLRRHLTAGDAVPDDRLAWMEQIVDHQAVVLIDCRDEETHPVDEQRGPREC